MIYFINSQENKKSKPIAIRITFPLQRKSACEELWDLLLSQQVCTGTHGDTE